jgi:hypothetical protein
MSAVKKIKQDDEIENTKGRAQGTKVQDWVAL